MVVVSELPLHCQVNVTSLGANRFARPRFIMTPLVGHLASVLRTMPQIRRGARVPIPFLSQIKMLRRINPTIGFHVLES